jgi:hypothetical protein
MSIDPGKVIERSVDSVQKIYAVVIALAISQAIQSLLKDPTGATDLGLQRLSSGLPAFLAFLVTLVPFWHGMNRHLDRCYLEKTDAVVQGALLLDFVTFFVEATFLFAAGWSLRSGIDPFRYLGYLLCVDMLWAFISHQIHFPGKKSHAVKWSTINIAAMFLAILLVAYPFERKPLVLTVVAVMRSIADYALCWDFYFPRTPQQAKTVLAGAPGTRMG